MGHPEEVIRSPGVRKSSLSIVGVFTTIHQPFERRLPTNRLRQQRVTSEDLTEQIQDHLMGRPFTSCTRRPPDPRVCKRFLVAVVDAVSAQREEASKGIKD